VPHKDWLIGEEMIAADVNAALADQVVATFGSASTRASEWATPPDGAVSYLRDTPSVLWLYEGGAWHAYGSAVGSLAPTVLAAAPPEHVMCYGQTLVAANVNYPALWAVVDPAWKSGSDLLVPDLRGRVIAGKDDMGGTNAGRLGGSGVIASVNMGAVGGSEWLHAHNHGVSDPTHDHGTGETIFGSGFVAFASGGQGVLTQTNGVGTGIGVVSTGSGNAQNVQPTMILNWILKVR
jgi:hypothetical protein